MDNVQIANLLTIIKGAYPFFPISQATPEAWNLVLGDVPHEAAIRALAVYLKEGHEFWPSPGRIHSMAVKAIEGPKPRKMTASEGFALVREAAKRFGKGNPNAAAEMVGMRSPRAYHVARAVGYDRFCDATDDSRPFLFRDFEHAWNDYVERETEETRALPLHGGQPMRIGDVITETVRRIGNG